MNKLLLCLAMGDERFAIKTSQIVEVVSLVQLRKLHKTPEWIAGIMRYHGQAVPVIDLCALSIGSPAKRLLSTRIILVSYLAKDGLEYTLGLIAERVTETIKYDPGKFVSYGVSPDGAPYLGKVKVDDEEVLQLLDVNSLFPASLEEVLFRHEEEGP